MATKPLTSFTFATDATFSSGPANTFPTKIAPISPAQGFIPGAAGTAEPVNYLFNLTGQWLTDWVQQGTSANSLDAHIVETGPSGEINIGIATFGNTSTVSRPVTILNNTSNPLQSALFVNHTGDGIALDVAGPRPAKFTGSGTFPCVELIGNGNPTDVLTVTSGVASTARGMSINTSDGTGGGLNIITSPTTPQPALRLNVSGGGAQERGSIRLPEMSPVGAQKGDTWKTPSATSTERGFLRYQDDNGQTSGGGAGPLQVMATPGGVGYHYDSDETDTTDGSGSLVSKLQTTIDTETQIRPGAGKYLVTFSCTVRLAPLVALPTRADVQFLVDGTPVNDFEIDFVAVGQRKPVCATIEVDVLPSILKVLEIKFGTGTATEDVICSNARIIAVGAYDQ